MEWSGLCDDVVRVCPSVFRRHGQGVLTERGVAVPHDLIQQPQGPFPFPSSGLSQQLLPLLGQLLELDGS